MVGISLAVPGRQNVQLLRRVQRLRGGHGGVPDHVPQLSHQPGQHGRQTWLRARAASTTSGNMLIIYY